jgi:hypothetical protein
LLFFSFDYDLSKIITTPILPYISLYSSPHLLLIV